MIGIYTQLQHFGIKLLNMTTNGSLETVASSRTSDLQLLHNAQGGVFATIFLTTITSNLLALYVLYQRKTKRPSIKFTLALCLEHIILGALLSLIIAIDSFFVSSSWIWMRNAEIWWYVFSVIFITHLISSSWIGLLISIDRFIAVKNSLRYSNWITNRTCICLLFLVITVSLSISLLQFLHTDKMHYGGKDSTCLVGLSPTTTAWKLYGLLIVFMGHLLPLLSNFYIYWSIYRATKNTTALARRNSFQPTTMSLPEPGDKDEEDKEPIQPIKRPSIRKLSGQLIVHKDNRKAAKMGTLVIVMQLLFFSPFYVVTSLSLLHFIESFSYCWLAVACLFLDCTASPIIYVLRNKSARCIFKSHCIASRRFKLNSKDTVIQTHSSMLFRLIPSQSSDDSIQTIA